MSANLIVNGSFEGGLFPWQTGGTGTVTSDATESFEGTSSASLNTPATGNNAVISQMVNIPSAFSSLHASWAMTSLTAATAGQLEVQVRFHGSGPTFPLLRTDNVFFKPAGDLDADQGWETAVIATAAKPAGAVQARIRFIATATAEVTTPVLIDNVVVTAE